MKLKDAIKIARTSSTEDRPQFVVYDCLDKPNVASYRYWISSEEDLKPQTIVIATFAGKRI